MCIWCKALESKVLKVCVRRGLPSQVKQRSRQSLSSRGELTVDGIHVRVINKRLAIAGHRKTRSMPKPRR